MSSVDNGTGASSSGDRKGENEDEKKKRQNKEKWEADYRESFQASLPFILKDIAENLERRKKREAAAQKRREEQSSDSEDEEDEESEEEDAAQQNGDKQGDEANRDDQAGQKEVQKLPECILTLQEFKEKYGEDFKEKLLKPEEIFGPPDMQ